MQWNNANNTTVFNIFDSFLPPIAVDAAKMQVLYKKCVLYCNRPNALIVTTKGQEKSTGNVN